MRGDFDEDEDPDFEPDFDDADICMDCGRQISRRGLLRGVRGATLLRLFRDGLRRV